MKCFAFFALWATLVAAAAGDKQPKDELAQFIQEAERSVVPSQPGTAGSVYSSNSPLVSLGLDLRASRINDLITVVVRERASALSKGSVQSSRTSDAKGSVTGLFGTLKSTNPLTNILGAGSERTLNGEGTTTRETVLSTSLTARVVHVLPNGNLVIEGVKNVTVNSETQSVIVRGIVRPYDVTTNNSVVSDQIASLDVRVNGKGVVQDAIRRPFFLYRLLLGILPF